MKVLLAALPLVLLAACGAEPGRDDAHNTILIENEAMVVPQANVAETVTGNTQAADEGAKVNLAPDGLSLVLPTGSARHVTFGQPRAAALRMRWSSFCALSCSRASRMLYFSTSTARTRRYVSRQLSKPSVYDMAPPNELGRTPHSLHFRSECASQRITMTPYFT